MASLSERMAAPFRLLSWAFRRLSTRRLFPGFRGARRCLGAERLTPAHRLGAERLIPAPRAPVEVLQARHSIVAASSFLERTANVLCFGLPGTGKTHAACALGHALVQHGHAVLFTPTFQLVQELLAAKRDLALPRALRRLDAFDVIILDDLGYVQQSAEEVEVLFTLMAERYERRSMIITSNLVFGEWDQIFKSPMTTAAAIDRIVHHSVILEFDGPSIRAEEAKKRSRKDQPQPNA